MKVPEVERQVHDKYTKFTKDHVFHELLFTGEQSNKPWTWSNLKRMTSGPSRPPRPFTVGYRWTKSCKPVTGKLTTHFYLKDLTWSDDNNMYLGPMVAAQQVLDPSPQTSCPRKEKKGGAHPLQPSLQESRI